MSTHELPGPGKRRSKAGCLTCRQRRKKCDETHADDHGGACQRCIQGAWQCAWPPPREARPPKVFERGSKRPRVDGAPSGDEQQATSAAGPVASTSAQPYLPATSEQAVASSSSGLPAGFLAAAPPPTTASFVPPVAPAPASTLAQHAPLPAFDSAAFPAFPPADAATHFALPAYNAVSFNPFADLSHSLNGVDDFFQSLDLEIAGWDSLATASATAEPSPAGALGDPPPAPAVQLLADAGDNEKIGWVDPTYNALNDAYLGSLAKPLRDVAVQRVYKTVISNELGRNAAMAIQSQKKLCDNPVGEAVDAQQQAQLRAMADRYFQRALDHVHHETIPLGAKLLALVDLYEHQFISVGAGAAAFIRLLGEHFIQELGRPLLDLSSIRDPEKLLLAIFGWHDCIRCITSGKRRILFAFSYLPGEPTAPGSSVLIDDVNSVVCEMPVLLGLPVGLMLCAAAIANLSAERDALPDELVKAKATAIEAAVRGWRPPALSAHDLPDSAKYLERISTGEMWRHAIIIYLYQSVWRHGPISCVILAAVQQILQIGARVLHDYEPSPSMAPAAPDGANGSPPRPYPHVPLPTAATTTAFAEALSSSDVPGSSISARTMSTLFSPLSRAIPFFLAGTCALLPSERALCLRGLQACGPLKGYLDDIAALERVWQLQDETGWLRDWREVLEEEKMPVAFM
ncbi:hypothetical protein JCM10450v2_002864 [Rhodotorula kratochvilovae]